MGFRCFWNLEPTTAVSSKPRERGLVLAAFTCVCGLEHLIIEFLKTQAS